MSETWDLVDVRGVSLGRTHRRGSSPLGAGEFHVVAAVCAVDRRGRMLITRRAAEKEFGCSWEFPGGSALAGETSRAAARRELREETGLELPESALTAVGRFVEASALVDLYAARASGRLRVDPAEVAAADWREREEVQELLRSGGMAEPWLGRLAALWAPLLEALRER